MKFLFIFFLSFLYIYGPVFNSIGVWADSVLLISILLILYNLLLSNFLFPKYIKPFLILVPLFIYLSFSVSLYPKIEFADYLQVILRPLRILITLLGGYSLFKIILSHYKTEASYKLIEIIFFSIVLHSIIMLIQFQVPAFKDYIYKYTSTGEFRSTFEYDFRMGGLTGGSGGAILSVVQSTGILLLPFLFKKANVTKKVIYTIGGALVFSSILICGRSGIWSIIVFFPITIFLVKRTINANTIFKMLLVFSGIVILFIGLLKILAGLNEDDPIFYALNRSLDTFIFYQNTGVFEDETTQILLTNIILPNDFSIILFGKGEHIVNYGFERTLNSDIGYIRNLWSFGLIGTIAFLFPLFWFTYESYKYKKKYTSACLLFLFSLIMIFFNSKENFAYVRMLFSMYSLALANFYFNKSDIINSSKNKATPN